MRDARTRAGSIEGADDIAHTIVDPVPAGTNPSLSLPSSTTMRDLSSEAERRSSIDLHLRRQLWWLSSVTLVLCMSAVGSIFVLGGGDVVRRLFMASMLMNIGTGVWMGWMARTQRMTVKNTTIAWFIISTGGCATIAYFGLFSAVGLMAAVFIVFFVGTRDERRVVVMVYAIFALFHAVLAGLVIAGRFDDTGVLTFIPRAAPGGSALQLFVVEALVQLLLLVTLVASTAIRAGMVSTVRDLELRARIIGHHELLLDDAKRAFEASLRAGGGGRFSHLIGEGAMGEVYDAVDTRTGAPAAVKLLRRAVMEDRWIVQRFLTEARVVTSLQTDHIARVLETADPGAGLPYIAMERLHGHDLRTHMRDSADARLPLDEAADLLHQVAQGIDTAHRAGVVHRDLKPSNLFRTDDGTWKILDFGVSKVLGEHTAANSIVGTPNFMAPEQVKGRTVDRRADIFALGAILYYAITGKLAFQGKNLAAVAVQVTQHRPPCPSLLVRGISTAVDEAIMTALAKDPRKRFTSATDFAAALRRASAVRPPASASIADGSIPPLPAEQGTLRLGLPGTRRTRARSPDPAPHTPDRTPANPPADDSLDASG
jgi:eukaryotic-like serine/threonine-protein kinase